MFVMALIVLVMQSGSDRLVSMPPMLVVWLFMVSMVELLSCSIVY